MSLKKDLDKLKVDAERTARTVRAATEALRRTASGLREQIGISAPITTEAIVAIVGSSTAVIISAENISQHALLVKELEPGDVIWRVREAESAVTYWCAARVARKAGVIRPATTDANNTAEVREREGSLAIVSGHLILHCGVERYNMLTARLME